jgi:hypothetical protein
MTSGMGVGHAYRVTRLYGLFYFLFFLTLSLCAGDENRQGGGHIYRVPRLYRGAREVGPDQVRSLRRAHSAFQSSCESRTCTQGNNTRNRNLNFSTVLSITIREVTTN